MEEKILAVEFVIENYFLKGESSRFFRVWGFGGELGRPSFSLESSWLGS